MKLTKNFSKSEFECKCGCDMPQDVLENIKIVAEQLQIVRDKLNKAIKINSAYRCQKHNEIIGGAKNSQHKLGKASDIVVNGMSTEKMFSLLNIMMIDKEIKTGGLGLYNTFVHMDIRGHIARWDNRS
jgi:uncharacterized protein YcbK (DUF882 family)